MQLPRALTGTLRGQEDGAQGKLLELADQRDEEQPTPSTQRQGETDEDEAMDDPAIASVITQVSSRDQQGAAPAAAAVQYAGQPDDGAEARSNWKNKFKWVARGRAGAASHACCCTRRR